MDPSLERREFVRIAIHDKVLFRLLEPDEVPLLSATILTRAKTERLAGISGSEAGSEFQRQVSRRMEAIEAKLDMILNLLTKKEPLHEGVLDEVRVVNMSASGLLFDVPYDPKLKADDHIEVRLLLTGMTGLPLQTLARVVRAEPLKNQVEPVWQVAVSFEVISESDRETLVSYTFSHMRQEIQERHLEEEEEEKKEKEKKEKEEKEE